MSIIWEEVAFERMFCAAKVALPNEVGGLGLVRTLPDGTLYIYETILLPQRVSGASTDLDKQGMSDWMTANPDKVPDCKVWWHSHANFGVFLSGTDQACITELLRIMPWLITPVVNVKNEIIVQLHLKEPCRQSFDVEYDVESAISRADRECKVEVPANIIKEAPVVQKEWRHRYKTGKYADVQTPDGDLRSVYPRADADGNLWSGWDRKLDGIGLIQDGAF